MKVDVVDLDEQFDLCMAAVRNGHTVTITDQGRPFARIEPIGLATRIPASWPKTPAADPIEIAETVSDLIDDQRR